MSNLLELAERCEQATAEHLVSVALKDAGNAIFDYGSDAEQARQFYRHIRNGAYVDAALTLVPEGEEEAVLEAAVRHCIAWKVGRKILEALPLAICAAALRARHSRGGHDAG